MARSLRRGAARLRRRTMAYDATPEHEGLCRRCGGCCYEKITVDGHVFTTRTPCPYLDVGDNRCTVYERRFEVNPRCLDVPGGVRFHVFPGDCPYVRDLPDYEPPVEGWLEEETVRRIEDGVLRTSEEIIEEMQERAREGGM